MQNVWRFESTHKTNAELLPSTTVTLTVKKNETLGFRRMFNKSTGDSGVVLPKYHHSQFMKRCSWRQDRKLDLNTCVSYQINHVDLVNRCARNPDLEECNTNCFDSVADYELKNGSLSNFVAPIITKQGFSSNYPLTTMWPSLNRRGDWFEDEDYCSTVAGTVNRCFLGRFRYSLFQHNKTSEWDALTSSQACGMLRRFGISNLVFYGDSLIRHLAQAMVLLLKNNLTYSVHGHPECIENMGFSKSKCRLEQFEHSVCGNYPESSNSEGALRVHFRLHNPTKRLQLSAFDMNVTSKTGKTSKTLTIFGIGNHPPTGGKSGRARLGIFNLNAYKRLHFTQFTPEFWGRKNYLMWVPTHFKMNIGRADETNERAWSFLQESDKYFSSIGAFTLNTFHMTMEASRFICRSCGKDGITCDQYHRRDTCEQTNETWDGYHYSFTMNAWKAQLLLARFIRFVTTF